MFPKTKPKLKNVLSDLNCKESSWNADAQLQLEPTWLQSAAFVATKSINPSFRTNIRNIWSVQTLLKNTLFLPTPAPDFCDCKKSLERNINDYSTKHLKTCWLNYKNPIDAFKPC